MEKLSLIELYQIKSRLIKESMTEEPIWVEVLESIKVIEDKIIENTSATGGPFVGGGGGMSGNPVDLGKTPLGPKWASGSTNDKGYINVPYNPSGTNRMMQRIPVMGKDHGARTGKKSREKRLDIKALRAALAKRKDFERKDGEKKVMSFDNFTKDDFSRIKKESLANEVKLDLTNEILDLVESYLCFLIDENMEYKVDRYLLHNKANKPYYMIDLYFYDADDSIRDWNTLLDYLNPFFLKLKDKYDVNFLGKNTLRLYMDDDVDCIIYNIDKGELTKPVSGKVNFIEIEVKPL